MCREPVEKLGRIQFKDFPEGRNLSRSIGLRVITSIQAYCGKRDFSSSAIGGAKLRKSAVESAPKPHPNRTQTRNKCAGNRPGMSELRGKVQAKCTHPLPLLPFLSLPRRLGRDRTSLAVSLPQVSSGGAITLWTRLKDKVKRGFRYPAKACKACHRDGFTNACFTGLCSKRSANLLRQRSRRAKHSRR